MATGTITLPVLAAVLPDGSASNLAPAVVVQKGGGAAPTPYIPKLLFDAAQLEQCMWNFRMPADYASAPVLNVQFSMASAVTLEVMIIGRIAAITPGDATDVDAKTFAAANTSAATTVPATTAGKVGEIALSLSTNDSLAAGDYVVVYLARDGANAGDDAAGDMEVLAVSLSYTTT